MEKHWTSHFIELKGVKIHYCRTGEGKKPPIVLVHGFSDSGLCWSAVARELEVDYDVIMPDMRGHGLSGRVGSGPEKVDMAQDLAELILALGLKHPILVGHSMGAMVVFQLAVRYPDLPGVLIFEDPPWWITAPSGFGGDGEEGDNPIAAWAKTLPGISLEELLESYTRDNPVWPEETIRYMCESKKQLDIDIVDIMSAQLQLQNYDWKEELPGFRQPVLVIRGDPESGGFVTQEVMEKIHKLNPDAETVHISGVGHLIKYDAFSRFVSCLKDFLAVHQK